MFHVMFQSEKIAHTYCAERGDLLGSQLQRVHLGHQASPSASPTATGTASPTNRLVLWTGLGRSSQGVGLPRVVWPALGSASVLADVGTPQYRTLKP